jgi:hypothetical protein
LGFEPGTNVFAEQDTDASAQRRSQDFAKKSRPASGQQAPEEEEAQAAVSAFLFFVPLQSLK